MLVAWGALAFGAPLLWAFLPLFTGCALVGAFGLLQHAGGKTDVSLAAALALVAGAIGLQLVPLPITAIQWLSPETDLLLRRYAVGYAFSQRHSLSIQPPLTVRGLAAFIALAVFLVGLARALTRDDTRQIARGVGALGLVIAVIGIAQKAMWNGKIYGFWMPIQAGNSFGPFVNRNHFAGWMLIALPLTVGYVSGRLTHEIRRVKPGWRNRLSWLSSAQASEITLLGFAVAVMALSLMLTMSRSGMIGLVAALAISGWFAVRHNASRSKRVAIPFYLLFVGLAAAGWTGYDRIASRFAEGEFGSIGGRVGIWLDAWRIAERFPLTGTGLNTYGVATLFYQTVDLQEHFAQAHNDYLQLLAEGGFLLCIPVVLAIVAFVYVARRRFREVPTESTDYWIRAGAVTGIIAIAIQEVSEFSLQMPGIACLFVVLMAITLRSPDDLRSVRSRAELLTPSKPTDN